MANYIQMTPGDLRDAGTALEGYRSDLDTLLGNIKSKVESLYDGWDGAAENAFIETFEVIYNNMNPAFPDAVSNVASMLTQTADALDQADEDIASSLTM